MEYLHTFHVHNKGKTKKSTLWHSAVIAVRLFFTSQTQVLWHVAQLPFKRAMWEFPVKELGRDLRVSVWPFSSFLLLHMPGSRSKSEKKDGVLYSPEACTQLYCIGQYMQFSYLNIPIVLRERAQHCWPWESLTPGVCAVGMWNTWSWCPEACHLGDLCLCRGKHRNERTGELKT